MAEEERRASMNFNKSFGPFLVKPDVEGSPIKRAQIVSTYVPKQTPVTFWYYYRQHQVVQ